MAFFGKGAPPALRTVSDGEVPWTPLDEEQDEGGSEEEGVRPKLVEGSMGPGQDL